MNSGGYSNESRNDGPPRNVLSEETVRQALANANRSQSGSSNKSSSHSPKPHAVRRTATGSSAKSARDCDCLDCRDTSARDTYGTERIDRETGDRIREHSGSGNLPLHLHGVRDDERPGPPRRSSTASSTSSRRSGSGRTGSDKNISTTRDREGNHVQSWSGSEAPPVRAHYDWDAPENQINFPDAPRRTNTSGSSRHA